MGPRYRQSVCLYLWADVIPTPDEGHSYSGGNMALAVTNDLSNGKLKHKMREKKKRGLPEMKRSMREDPLSSM